MNIKIIKTVKDNELALARIEALWEAQPNTVKGNELETLITLVNAFEEKHFPIAAPDSIEAIKFRMDQQKKWPIV